MTVSGDTCKGCSVPLGGVFDTCAPCLGVNLPAPSPAPLPEDVEAAFGRVQCALFPQENFCWRMEQDDTDDGNCDDCIPESFATIRTALATAQSDALRLWEAADDVYGNNGTEPLDALVDELRPRMEARKR